MVESTQVGWSKNNFYQQQALSLATYHNDQGWLFVKYLEKK